MCLIVLGWRARADLPLVVAANRDEWRQRPTEPAHFWPDHPQLLAGRDLTAGGTWMGVTREGRFAAVTNFRDPSDKRSAARSRGGIVTEFLLGSDTPESFIASLAAHAAEYNGFNLLAGDGESLWYYGSREGVARAIEPGIHALSNHLLDTPWPKVQRSRRAMEAALADGDPAPKLFAAMADDGTAPEDSLPATGVGIDWERRLSAALITGADYGTRSTTVMTMDDHGGVRFEEHTLDAGGTMVGKRIESLRVENP